MIKHTPGPWEVEVVTSGKDEVYARIKGVAFSDGIKVGVYKKKLPEEAMANARLIAAAPKLLEACKDTARTLEAILNQECDIFKLDEATKSWSKTALSHLNQTIAKAE